MLDWLGDNRTLLTWITIGGVVMFIMSLVAVPLWVAKLPADYYSHRKRPPSILRKYPPAVRLGLRVGKNVLGVVLALAGIAMLLLPGQGVLTLIIGLALIEYPGKYQIEKKLIARPRVLKAVNWIRRKAGREPLIVRAASEEADSGRSKLAPAR
jgi:hypothetical protein